jgi:transposase
MSNGNASLLFFREELEIRGSRLRTIAAFWKLCCGLCGSWRDLPESFGQWNSVFKRFRRWTRRGVFEQICAALSEDADFEYVIIDGTIVRVHQHGTGAQGGTQNQAIGGPAVA